MRCERIRHVLMCRENNRGGNVGNQHVINLRKSDFKTDQARQNSNGMRYSSICPFTLLLCVRAACECASIGHCARPPLVDSSILIFDSASIQPIRFEYTIEAHGYLFNATSEHCMYAWIYSLSSDCRFHVSCGFLLRSEWERFSSMLCANEHPHWMWAAIRILYWISRHPAPVSSSANFCLHNIYCTYN